MGSVMLLVVVVGGGGGADSINSSSMKNLRLNKSLWTLTRGLFCQEFRSRFQISYTPLLIGTASLYCGNVLNTLNELDSQHNNYFFSNKNVLLLHVSAIVRNHYQVVDSYH